MHENVLPRCHYCGQNAPGGLFDGFRIAGVFFCRSCERCLMSAEIGSQEYQLLAQSIREVLFPRASSSKQCTQSI